LASDRPRRGSTVSRRPTPITIRKQQRDLFAWHVTGYFFGILSRLRGVPENRAADLPTLEVVAMMLAYAEPSMPLNAILDALQRDAPTRAM
jgi:hypothetical protein